MTSVPDSTLRVALDWEVDLIDPPASFGGWNTGRVVQQIFESLYEDDLENEVADPTKVIPSLAGQVMISEDGLKYTFILREGVLFHDGTSFDASVAKFNIERMWDKTSPQFSEVAADYNRIGLEFVESVEDVDHKTLVITLREPFVEFIRYMTQEDAPGAHVYVSQSAIEKYGNAGVADHAPGTGPFKFEQRFDTIHGSGVKLVKNERYWGGGAPKLDGIEFKPYPQLEDRYHALLNDEVDLAYGLEGSDLQELEKQGFTVLENSVPYIWYFMFNMQDPVLRDVRVRRAIAHSIDREKLAFDLFRSHVAPAPGMLPPSSPSFDPSYIFPYKFDVDRAKSLMEEANVPRDWRLSITTAAAGSGQLLPVEICEYLKKSLEHIGYGVDIHVNQDWISFCENWRAGIPDGIGMTQMSWGMSCDVWLEQVLHSKNAAPAGFNSGRYSSESVDALLSSARGTADDGKRISLYREAHDLIMHDLPILPMLILKKGMVCYHPRVRNFKSPKQNWHSFSRVYLDHGS